MATKHLLIGSAASLARLRTLRSGRSHSAICILMAPRAVTATTLLGFSIHP